MDLLDTFKVSNPTVCVLSNSPEERSRALQKLLQDSGRKNVKVVYSQNPKDRAEELAARNSRHSSRKGTRGFWVTEVESEDLLCAESDQDMETFKDFVNGLSRDSNACVVIDNLAQCPHNSGAFQHVLHNARHIGTCVLTSMNAEERPSYMSNVCDYTVIGSQTDAEMANLISKDRFDLSTHDHIRKCGYMSGFDHVQISNPGDSTNPCNNFFSTSTVYTAPDHLSMLGWKRPPFVQSIRDLVRPKCVTDDSMTISIDILTAHKLDGIVFAISNCEEERRNMLLRLSAGKQEKRTEVTSVCIITESSELWEEGKGHIFDITCVQDNEYLDRFINVLSQHPRPITFILDNISSEVYQRDSIQDLITNARLYMASVYVSAKNVNSLPPTVRQQVDYTCIGKQDKDEIAQVESNVTAYELCEIHDHVSEKKFILIVDATKPEHRLQIVSWDK